MKKLLLIFLLLPSVIHAQTIVTISGNGTNGSSGDNGPATAAKVANPSFGACDAAGNYYFNEGFASTGPKIRMINTAGIIKTVAGSGSPVYSGDGGPATAAGMSNPIATVDAAGNIYIADYYARKVRKVDATSGIIHLIAGNGASTSTGDGGPATAATLIPSDLCVDGAGNIFITDSIGGIRKIDAVTGIISHISSVHGNCICLNASGKIILGKVVWVFKIDSSTGVVDTIAGTGVATYNGDGIPATAASIRAYDVTGDAVGNIYIADDVNYRVRMIDAGGIIHTIAGTGVAGFNGDNIPATAAKLYDPEGLAFDPCGNLYIADLGNNRIRKVFLSTTPPAITIFANPGNVVCKRNPVSFYNTVTMGSATSYQWLVNGNPIAGATNSTYSYIPNDLDSVRCIMTGIGQCSGASATVSSNSIYMTVIPTYITPTISISSITAALVGAMVTVTATVTNAGSSYSIKWFNKGVLFNTTTVPVVTYTKTAGTDTITATVSSTSIAVVGCYDTTTSSAITIADSTNGVQSIASKGELFIYPNPAKDIMHIDGVVVPSSYKLFSVVGNIVRQGTLKEGDNSIPVQSLPAGVYMVEVSGSDGKRVMKKIIKE